MGLLADRAEGHGPRLEALHDRRYRLDLLDGDGRALFETEKAAELVQVLGAVVDQLRVFLEKRVLARPACLLKGVHALGIVEVELAVFPPLPVPALVEGLDGAGAVGVGLSVADRGFLGDLLEADAADSSRRAGEVGVDEGIREPEGLEYLGALVGLDGGNPHLGHGLDDALVGRLDEVRDRLLGGRAVHHAVRRGVLDRLEGEVGVDGRYAVADEAGEVMDLPRLPRFEDEAHLGPRFLFHEVMVETRDGEEGRYRGLALPDPAVGEDDDRGLVGHGLIRLVEEVVEGLLQPLAVPRDGEKDRKGDGLESGPVEGPELGELRVRQNRVLDHDPARRRFVGMEEIAL